MTTDTSGIPIPGSGPRGRAMFSSLRHAPYRLLLIGQFVGTIAVWSQRIAVDWILLEMTGDLALVGSLVALQFGPVLLFGLWGGVLVDRHSLRTLLLISQTTSLGVGAVLAATALSSTMTPLLIFVCAGVQGLAAVVDQPARQVLVSRVVSPNDLANAISMNSISFQVGGMIGPAVSGALLAASDGAGAFVFSLSLQAVAFAALVALFARARFEAQERSARARGQIMAGLRYALSKPEIRDTLLLLVFVCLVGLNWPVLLVAMTTVEFHSGADGYGLANTALAAGSFVGALISLRRVHRGLRTVVFAVCAVCTFRMACGVAPREWVFLLGIAATGIWLILLWTAANSLLQWSSNSAVRGRIMSIYLMISVGGQALGGPLLGWACATVGPRTTLLVSGALPLCAAAVLGILHRRRRSRM
ncbi:MFS transporter [Microbacterium sp.]|uniref:MFS transporter n=1 Tax=Microbacterium sp. TaxID=51671 RepID=UPI0039E28CA8